MNEDEGIPVLFEVGETTLPYAGLMMVKRITPEEEAEGIDNGVRLYWNTGFIYEFGTADADGAKLMAAMIADGWSHFLGAELAAEEGVDMTQFNSDGETFH